MQRTYPPDPGPGQEPLTPPRTAPAGVRRRDLLHHPVLSERRNIVFIADEAHRSHYGFKSHVDKATGYIRYGFAEYIRQALPNASSIGFTGTPISLADRDIRAVFGDYISIYDVVQANEDSVTVSIYYEGRHIKLDLAEEEKPLLDEGFEEITENEEENVRERLRSKWAQLEAVIGAEHRIDVIAEDLVAHFEKRLEALEGKAMIVCMSRRICVEMYDAISRLRPGWHSDDDISGAVKVVIAGSASERLEWQMHFRTKTQRDRIRSRFVDPDDPLKIVIVRAVQENAYMMTLFEFYWVAAALGLMNTREGGYGSVCTVGLNDAERYPLNISFEQNAISLPPSPDAARRKPLTSMRFGLNLVPIAVNNPTGVNQH